MQGVEKFKYPLWKKNIGYKHPWYDCFHQVARSVANVWNYRTFNFDNQYKKSFIILCWRHEYLKYINLDEKYTSKHYWFLICSKERNTLSSVYTMCNCIYVHQSCETVFNVAYSCVKACTCLIATFFSIKVLVLNYEQGFYYVQDFF